MTHVLWAFAFLAVGVIGSVIFLPWPRASLAAALFAVCAAGLLFLRAGVGALLVPATEQSRSLAWPLPLGNVHLALDALSGWFLLPTGIVGLAAAIYSWGYFRGVGRAAGAIGPLMCVLIAGMAITVCAADVLLFLLGWELMSLSAFLLVGFHHREPEARRGAWMYLVATHLGTALGVLPVFGLLVARTGSTSFAAFGSAFEHAAPLAASVMFCLGLVGFGTKAGLMPMHVWLPVAHPVAPSPVSALMSGVVIKTGIYGLLRLLTWLPTLPIACALAVMGMGIVSGIVGILYALPQRQYKRMLAYSSVENMGIIAIGIGLGMLGEALHQPAVAVLGFGGAILHVLNHSLFKGLLFLSAGAVLHGSGTDDIERLGGVARRDRANAMMFLLGSVAICALPPLNGFVSEFLIYNGFARSLADTSLLVAVTGAIAFSALALIGGLALVAFSKLFAVIFLGEPRDRGIHVHPASPSMLLGMGVLAIGCVLVALGAPSAGFVLRGPLREILGIQVTKDLFLEVALRPLASVIVLFAMLLVLVGGLFVLRRRLGSSQEVITAQPTWGCGFAGPSPRMQYTGSSYVWGLVGSFWAVIRARRSLAKPRTWFPDANGLRTESRDAALESGYRRLFTATADICERLWPLQHGRIQLYLVYIVATVVIAFAVELGFSPFSDKPSANAAASVSEAASSLGIVRASGGQDRH